MAVARNNLRPSVKIRPGEEPGRPVEGGTGEGRTFEARHFYQSQAVIKVFREITEEEVSRILNEPRPRTCACCGAESSEGICSRCERAEEEQERITMQVEEELKAAREADRFPLSDDDLEWLGITRADYDQMPTHEREEAKEACGMLGNAHGCDQPLPYKCTGTAEFPTWEAESFIAHLQKEHEQKKQAEAK